MKEAGISVVLLGEGSWSHLEPDADYYNFRWLNRAMDVFLKETLQVVLCIPTGSPPPWMVAAFPEILPMDSEGRRIQPGTLNHRCFLNKQYRDHARNFTVRLTKEIWGHRAIIGWQVESQLAATRCYCETCHRAFLEWLQKKHGNIDNLNKNWGTIVGGQEYSDFGQIPLPWRHTGDSNDARAHNPSLVLDFWRFSSEVAVEFAGEMAAIVRRYTTRQFVSIGLGSASFHENDFQIARSVDCIACHTDSFEFNLACSLTKKNFWLTGLPVGAVGRNELGPFPRPGEFGARAWQAVGSGADAVAVDRWRSHLSGAGQLADGVLGHDGVPRRRYAEVITLGNQLARARKASVGSETKNQVAILWDHEQLWALEIQRQTEGAGIRYVGIAESFHRALGSLGVGCDFVAPQMDLQSYKLLLCPPQYLLEDEMARKFHQYVSDGGFVIFPTRTAVKNRHNVHRADPLPGPLRTLLGIEIEETVSLGDARTIRVRLEDGNEFEAGSWCDVLTLKGAKAIGTFQSEFFNESAAVTVREHGNGRAYYVATAVHDDLYRVLLTNLLNALGIRAYKDLPNQVRIATRFKGDRKFIIAANLGMQPRAVNLRQRGKNLLDEATVESILKLDAFGVAVVEVTA